MRDTDGLQTTFTLSPVNSRSSTLSVELELQMTLPMPDQDDQLPDRIEALVHHAGLEVQRRLFRAHMGYGNDSRQTGPLAIGPSPPRQ